VPPFLPFLARPRSVRRVKTLPLRAETGQILGGISLSLSLYQAFSSYIIPSFLLEPMFSFSGRDLNVSPSRWAAVSSFFFPGGAVRFSFAAAVCPERGYFPLPLDGSPVPFPPKLTFVAREKSFFPLPLRLAEAGHRLRAGPPSLLPALLPPLACCLPPSSPTNVFDPVFEVKVSTFPFYSSLWAGFQTILSDGSPARLTSHHRVFHRPLDACFSFFSTPHLILFTNFSPLVKVESPSTR